MTYLGFEAGSRAGFSAELFFRDYVNQTGSDDRLVLSDADKAYSYVETASPYASQIERVCDDVLEDKFDLNSSDVVIFPCDELTRQTKDKFYEIAQRSLFSKIDKKYYDKAYVNRLLLSLSLPIKIPYTFRNRNVCLRPNTESAGSKGVMFLHNYCVSEFIDIAEEYVVDCCRIKGELSIFPRAVTLKNGYDRYIKFIGKEDKLVGKVIDFVESFNRQMPSFGLFDGVFHLQLAKDKNGEYWYIESSKRISGTSFVNLSKGYNPFMLINGHKVEKPTDDVFEYGRWYRFEDVLYETHRYVESR